MTTTTGRAPLIGRARFPFPIVGLALAIIIATVGLLLFAREYLKDDPLPLARVPADHAAKLNEEITFFETRVTETKDHLSYDRLTALYLQRLRETGDVADLNRAASSAQKSNEALPEAYTGTVNLAFVKIAQHDFSGALALATRARDFKPKVPDAHAVSGDALLALGQYDAAGDNYRVYLELAPGFGAFSRMAAIAEARANYPLAMQYWDQAIDITRLEAPGDSAWARVQLGNLHLLRGDSGKARDQYETALRVYPGMAAAEFGLARAHAARREFDAAANRLAPLVQRQPLAEYVVFYGEVLQRAGKPEAAARQFALVGAIGELYAANGIRDDLTVIAFALDHGDASARVRALADAKAAYEARPSGQVADLLGWAHFRNGEFAAAGKFADSALATGPRESQLLYHAGMIADALGEIARARELLAETLAINPEFSPSQAPVAKTTLERLKAN